VARPPKFAVEHKQQIVLSVLRETSVKEASRRSGVSETSIAKWRDQFLVGGAGSEGGNRSAEEVLA
jgi:transposase